MAQNRLEIRDGLANPSGHSGPDAPAATTPHTDDVYFSADVETDGPIPGEFSMLSFALVYAGRFDGKTFEKASAYTTTFESTLRPISANFQEAAMAVNRLDRAKLCAEGNDPANVMRDAASWIQQHAKGGTPVLVAYPLSFDWSWLYWYFVRFAGASPFNHSRCFDLKTAIAVRGRRTVNSSGHEQMPDALRSALPHTHNALDDAIEQADMLAKFFAWDGK